MAFDESVCALPEMGGDFQNSDEEHQEAMAERTDEEWCQREERGKVHLSHALSGILNMTESERTEIWRRIPRFYVITKNKIARPINKSI